MFASKPPGKQANAQPAAPASAGKPTERGTGLSGPFEAVSFPWSPQRQRSRVVAGGQGTAGAPEGGSGGGAPARPTGVLGPFEAVSFPWPVVQRESDPGGEESGGAEPDRHPVHIAESGLSGEGQPLPHLDRIQSAFGTGHDLSGVRAHIGGPAALASRALGARAYTTGERVAFRAPPDLRLAAHEAAHVVQQRRGVHLKNDVGETGDPYEKHADAVADRVAAGKPAGELLPGAPAPSAAPPPSPDTSSTPEAESGTDVLAKIDAWGKVDGGMEALLSEADTAMASEGKAPPTGSGNDVPVIQRAPGDPPDAAANPPVANNAAAANPPVANGPPPVLDPYGIASMSPEDCKKKVLEIVREPGSGAAYLQGKIEGEYLDRLLTKSMGYEALNPLATGGAPHERAMAVVALTEGGALNQSLIEGLHFSLTHPSSEIRRLGFRALSKLIDERGLHLGAVSRAAEVGLDAMELAELEAYRTSFPKLEPAIAARVALYRETEFTKVLTATDVALKTLLRSLLRAKETQKLQALIAGPDRGRLLPLLVAIGENKEEDAAVGEASRRFQRVLALAASLPVRPVSEIRSLTEGLGKDAAQAIDAFLLRQTDRSTDRYRELYQLGGGLSGGKPLSAPAPKAAPKIEYLADVEQVTTRTLQSKIDLLVARLQSEVPLATTADVERLQARKIELAKLPQKDVPAEATLLDKGLLILEMAVALGGMLPRDVPEKPPEIRAAVQEARAAIVGVAGALGGTTQEAAATRLLKAHTGYVDVYTRRHIEDASSGKSALVDLAVKPEGLEKLTNGYARMSTIYFGSSVDEWSTLESEVASLQTEMGKMGDLQAKAALPLADRLKFLGSDGSDIGQQLLRVQALTTLANAFRVGAALMKGVTDQDDVVWTDMADIQGLLSEVIRPLAKQLTGGKAPDVALLGKASSHVSYLLEKVKKRLTELEAAHKRQEWGIEIASTLVGMGAMSRAMKAMKAVEWFYRGGRAAMLGKQALKFAIGSLVFTTASTTTKSILTGQLPTAAEFAKQAGMDLATLGLLHGMGRLTGLLFVKPTTTLATKEAIQLGTTFGTLWAWASAQTIWNLKPEEQTLDNILKAIVATGARTALDLSVLHVGAKIGSMPRIGSAAVKEKAQKDLITRYDETRAAAKEVEKQLADWHKDGADPKKLDPILEKGNALLGRLRSIYDRMLDQGMLKPEEQKALSDATFTDQAQIQNIREAARLRLQVKSDSTQSYRANERDLDLYLKRLKAQGVIKTIVPRAGGVFEVRYDDGTTGWFYPEGTPPPGDGKAIYRNEVPSTEVKHLDGLAEGLRKFAAAEKLRFVQTAAESGVKLEFKDGFPVIGLGKAYTPAELGAVVAEAERLRVDPKGGKKVEVTAQADRAGWDRAKETQESLQKLKGEQADKPVTADREHLASEIERQVPDLKLLGQVQAGTAKIVITLMVPGGGPTGVKTMNDKLIGYQLNNTLITPKRNAVIAEVFQGLPFNEKAGESMSVVEQSYKSTTLTTTVADAARLQRLMAEGMRRVDERMHPVLLDALTRGKTHWIAERDAAAGNKESEQYKDARMRAENIEQMLADLVKAGPKGFRVDMQFGMAEIKGGEALSADQAYKAALEAKMNAAKAAIMVRSGGERGSQEAAGGDTRGHFFDEKSFITFAANADALRAQIVASGNFLTIDRRPVKIFQDQGGELLPNPDILRDVRKDKIHSEDLPPQERVQLERIRKYMDHINAFDYIKGFTSQEGAQLLPARMQRAQALLEALRSGKVVDPAQVQAMMTQDVRGQVLPQMGTASEVAFYARAGASADRILLNADIIDLGLDAMMAYAKSMHAVSAGKLSGQALYDASNSVTDPLLTFRKSAISRISIAYEAHRQKAITALEKLPQRDAAQQAALDQLRKEADPLLLLGGDEITLSLHPAMQSQVAELVAEVAQASRGRVAVTRALTEPAKAGDQAARVEAHKKAMSEADPAANVLKSFEIALRKLKHMVGQVTDPTKQAEAQAIVDKLGLDQLYADVDPATGNVKLKRFKSGTEVSEADLKTQIADAQAEMHKRLGAPLPTVVTPSQQKKEDDEELRIRAVRRPTLPTPLPRVDFAAEALERAAPGVAADVRDRALGTLRRLPFAKVNDLLLGLPTGKADALVTWLATPGIGDTLAALDAAFAVALLLALLQDAGGFTRVKGMSAPSIRFWYGSGFEKIVGGKTATLFLQFLVEMERHRGGLTVKSAEEAKQAVDAYSKTGPAMPFNPATVERRGPTISALGTPIPAPPPYQSDGDYLQKAGETKGTFARVYIDDGRWIVQTVDGRLRRAWFFQGEIGNAPTKTVDIASALQKLEEGAEKARGKSKEEARTIAAGLTAELASLDFLRRVRDLDTKSAIEKMNAVEALRK